MGEFLGYSDAQMSALRNGKGPTTPDVIRRTHLVLEGAEAEYLRNLKRVTPKWLADMEMDQESLPPGTPPPQAEIAFRMAVTAEEFADVVAARYRAITIAALNSPRSETERASEDTSDGNSVPEPGTAGKAPPAAKIASSGGN